LCLLFNECLLINERLVNIFILLLYWKQIWLPWGSFYTFVIGYRWDAKLRVLLNSIGLVRLFEKTRLRLYLVLNLWVGGLVWLWYQGDRDWLLLGWRSGRGNHQCWPTRWPSHLRSLNSSIQLGLLLDELSWVMDLIVDVVQFLLEVIVRLVLLIFFRRRNLLFFAG
jgi:hypothetical protein